MIVKKIVTSGIAPGLRENGWKSWDGGIFELVKTFYATEHILGLYWCLTSRDRRFILSS